MQLYILPLPSTGSIFPCLAILRLDPGYWSGGSGKSQDYILRKTKIIREAPALDEVFPGFLNKESLVQGTEGSVTQDFLAYSPNVPIASLKIPLFYLLES